MPGGPTNAGGRTAPRSQGYAIGTQPAGRRRQDFKEEVVIIKVHHKHTGRRVAEAIAAFDPQALFRGNANEWGAILEADTHLTPDQVGKLLGVEMVYRPDGEMVNAEKFGLPF